MTPRPNRRGAPGQPQAGAALLTAMIIVALVATLAGSMVWQQWRAVQVESAERARTQSAWILSGALDFARLILREDGRTRGGAVVDHLGEPWAAPLAEARLSTFLAAEADPTEDGPEAFLSGSISDAQARFNLANLVSGGRLSKLDVEGLVRLCETVGVSADVALRIANGIRDATPFVPDGSAASGAPAAVAPADPPLMPRSVAQLRWLGIDAEAVRALEPYIVLLPDRSAINANTASREVLVAAVPGLDLATAERIVQARLRTPFQTRADIRKAAPQFDDDALQRLDVVSSYFEVHGRLRLGETVLEQRSLVWRRGTSVTVLRRERVSSRDPTTS